jgi:hypothetical protein
VTDPKQKDVPAGGHGIQLPPETIKRWREIVASSVKAGRDISVLVQQYAEQSFNAKLTSLDNQGVRRRMLARAHSSVEKELARADGHLKAEPKSEPTYLSKFYSAHQVELPSADTVSPAAAGERRGDNELHHTVTALPDPFRKRAELVSHVAHLTAQLAQINTELPRIDTILNRGLKNQQAVVQELAAVSKELYRLAQEVVAELPGIAPRSPTAAAVSKKSKLLKHLPPVAEAAAEPEPEAAAAPAPAVQRTVPINPLALGVRKLRQDLAKPTEALFHQVEASQKAAAHGIASASASVGRTLKPVGSALSTATHRVTYTSASFVGRFLAALGAALIALLQKIKDAWPWRGPAPPGS